MLINNVSKKFILFLIDCISSCAPSRFVKPLNKKEQVLNLSVGGPVVDYNNLPVPAPFVTATYGYGIDSSLTGFGSLNITSALYSNLQLEAGVVKRIVQQHHNYPGVSITPVANFISVIKMLQSFILK